MPWSNPIRFRARRPEHNRKSSRRFPGIAPKCSSQTFKGPDVSLSGSEHNDEDTARVAASNPTRDGFSDNRDDGFASSSLSECLEIPLSSSCNQSEIEEVEVGSTKNEQETETRSVFLESMRSTASTAMQDGDTNVDRAMIRMDGIEVYAVISSLTLSTSIACFDNFAMEDLVEFYGEGSYFEIFSSMLYFASGSVSVLTGLHTTLIFSLVTMYGRTAVGMNMDDAFNEFFGNTGLLRYKAFNSFLNSLYSFLIQMACLISHRAPHQIRPFVFCLAAYGAYKIYRDSQQCIKEASVMFVPQTNKNTSSKETSFRTRNIDSVARTDVSSDGNDIEEKEEVKERKIPLRKQRRGLSTRQFGSMTCATSEISEAASIASSWVSSLAAVDTDNQREGLAAVDTDNQKEGEESTEKPCQKVRRRLSWAESVAKEDRTKASGGQVGDTKKPQFFALGVIAFVVVGMAIVVGATMGRRGVGGPSESISPAPPTECSQNLDLLVSRSGLEWTLPTEPGVSSFLEEI